MLLGLITVVVLAATGVWNPFPGLWDWVDRSKPISEPDVVWQQRVGGTPRSVTIAGDTVIVEQRTRVESRNLADGTQLWERKADWSAVAGSGRESVVAVGKLLNKGYEVLDPVTGVTRRRDDRAIAVWTYRNLLLDAYCVEPTDCTLRAWEPRGNAPLWTAFLPGVHSGLLADNPELRGTRRLDATRIDGEVAGPESVPPLLGFPVDGRVHVLDTATGRVLQNVEPGRDERLSVVGGRLLRIAATSRDGSCYFVITAVDPATGQQVWRRAGINLRTADSAGCVQREDPQGARNVLIGVAPDGREAVLDGYDGRPLQVGAEGEKLLAVDDRYAVVRGAGKDSLLGRELSADRTRWTRPAGSRSGAALTPYAVVISDEKPSRLVAVEPREGRVLVELRTSANALAVGPNGMIIGEGREIGYVRWGAAAAGVSRPDQGPVPAPDPADTGRPPSDQGSCGPKRELCADGK
ncbi:PQQ-binding-like beta-propeller repeat protein [Micromonospora sp. WMMD1128]|uniref:outer membrane protein assembly factor BamB family protein n=1 Tax=unclassified Micromonospora TaxID=2617518 RepID=UPI00248CB37F|nr:MULTISPECIES: PQQ-binding-like beta-propeller repeat protein [unclassified Micromonospora]WBB76895.1 PQQ-binding-like beta-propeller repeat protein [Micromonospora sp. WMMD1128]WFE36794.1 PQQ-binding-like beta-propeller repeat protein [Micromonospora sp. WMMD975]